MTKELEALQRIEAPFKELGMVVRIDKEAFLKDINLIKEALKRNEPMKPNYDGKFPECPVCRKLLHSIWQKHCDSCTQAIDWSDEK